MRQVILYLAFLVSGTVLGQNTGSISGLVTDKINGEPLAYASVVIKNQSDIIVNGTITDGKGTFQFTKLAADSYVLEIEFIGYTSL